MLYGVAPPEAPFALYLATLRHYAKARHIGTNPAVTLAIPFPHRILAFVPANCVTFRGSASLVPLSDRDGVWAFEQGRILRDNLRAVEAADDPVFIRMDPEPEVFCYGLGLPLLHLARYPSTGSYKVRIDGP